MSDPDRQHLSEEEAWLAASQGTPWGQGAPLDSRWAELRTHLDSCPACQSKIQRLEKASMSLKRIGPIGKAEQGPGCPPEAEWPNLAADVISPDRARTLLSHAAQCDYCGALLREASEVHGAEVTVEEQAVLSQMKSSQAEWQREMARTLGRAQPVVTAPGHRRWFALPAWGYAAVAAVVITAVGLASWWRQPRGAAKAEMLLAQAYTEHRNLEMRFRGSEYATLRQQRGGGRDSRPLELPEAEALITRHLRSTALDADWIAAQGRYDLLELKAEEAIRRLAQAAEMRPQSFAVLTDLATAHFLRAEQDKRDADYAVALEWLGRALALRPEDPVALFNRAIVEERLFLYEQAITDWEHFLRVEPASGWSGEARERMGQVREKLLKRQQGAIPPSASPADFLKLNEGGQSGRQGLDRRIEEYQDVALRAWLPAAFPLRTSGEPSREALRALVVLADLLEDGHADSWLHELLKASSGPAFAAGVESLRRSISVGGHDRSQAAASAEQAERLFQTAGNEPARMRAALERVYTLHRSVQASACLELAAALDSKQRGRSYRWMAVQLLLEKAACLDMQQHHEESFRTIQAAEALASESHYGILELRAIAFNVAATTGRGNRLLAWSQFRRGMAHYYEHQHPPLRLFPFLDALGRMSEVAGHLHLARSLQSEAVKAISLTPNRSTQATAWARLGLLSAATGSPKDAFEGLRQAERLNREMPPSTATRNLNADVQIGLAKLEASQGSLDSSWRRIKAVEPYVPEVETYQIPLRFYATLGYVEQRRGERTGARLAFQQAVSVAEAGLRGITSDSDRVSWNRETGNVYRSLVQVLFQEKPSTAFETWEWYRAAALRIKLGPPSDPKISASAPTLNFEQVRAFLRGYTMLSFARLPEGWAVWIFDDRGLVTRFLPDPNNEIAPMARSFNRLCQDPETPLSDIRQLGDQLYTRLLSPVEDRLARTKGLMIEPDAELEGLPFQALLSAKSQNLGAQVALVYSPGILQLLLLGETPPLTSWDPALVVGSPALSPRWSARFPWLPDAVKEAEFVASRFRQSTLLTGSSATTSSVERALAFAAVFHFAGHALTETWQGGFLMAPSTSDPEDTGLLTVDQLKGHLRRCRLAVLSACSTERGQEEGFTDPQSPVRALLHAGVPQVVATRWNVDSASTGAFMRDFYDAVFAGLTVPAALQSAAAKTERRAATRHPYYWAGFNVYGRI